MTFLTKMNYMAYFRIIVRCVSDFDEIWSLFAMFRRIALNCNNRRQADKTKSVQKHNVRLSHANSGEFSVQSTSYDGFGYNAYT